MGELEKHARIFNLIAPAYNLYFGFQVKNYRSVLDKYFELLKLPPGGRVLDIGCGTGAFAYCLAERGYQAVGVDFSASMLRAARKSTLGKSIEFVQGATSMKCWTSVSNCLKITHPSLGCSNVYLYSLARKS